MSQGGFSVENDSVVHKWAMFRLVKRTARSPRGETFERTYVSTPGAVATVAVTDDGNVLLVSQYRASLGAVIQEIPAGMRDIEGEDPAVTAVRELREETGYVSTRIEFLGTCLSSPGVTDSSVDVYLATGLHAGESEPHGPEEDEMTLEVIPFAEALRRVDAGEITDAKTAFGLLMAARRHPLLVR